MAGINWTTSSDDVFSGIAAFTGLSHGSHRVSTMMSAVHSTLENHVLKSKFFTLSGTANKLRPWPLSLAEVLISPDCLNRWEFSEALP